MLCHFLSRMGDVIPQDLPRAGEASTTQEANIEAKMQALTQAHAMSYLRRYTDGITGFLNELAIRRQISCERHQTRGHWPSGLTIATRARRCHHGRC